MPASPAGEYGICPPLVVRALVHFARLLSSLARSLVA